MRMSEFPSLADRLLDLPPLPRIDYESVNLGKFEEQIKKIYSGVNISKKEADSMILPKRYSAVELQNIIRLPVASNILPKIDLSFTPYLIDPISLIGHERINWIIMVAPTQSGKTVFLQFAVADAILQNPANLFYIMPDEKNGKRQLKEKIIKMIEKTPELLAHAIPPYSKTMSMTSIELDNMTIYPAWSGSIGTLSSIPAKTIILDEIRLMKLAQGSESSAIQLAEGRLTTYEAFGGANVYGVSTPAIEGDLLHNQMSIPGTTCMQWLFQCQSCGKYYLPNYFKTILPNLEKYNESFISCYHCKEKQEEGVHSSLLNKNAAYGTRELWGETKIPKVTEQIKGRRAHFRFNSAASPFRSIDRMNLKFKETHKTPTDYRSFVQEFLAMEWENKKNRATASVLDKRIGTLERGIVPFGTKFLTAGVDVQFTGFYVTVLAHVSPSQIFLIDNFFIPCDIKTAVANNTERILFNMLDNRQWDGWKVRLWGIDVKDGNRLNELREATRFFNRCCLIQGAPSSQVVPIKFAKFQGTEEGYYIINKNPYMDKTDDLLCSTDFKMHKWVEPDFKSQLLRVKKVVETHPKTGEEKTIWEKTGQNDYRMALVYAMEVLDIMIEGVSLSALITDPHYIDNPAGIIEENVDYPELEHEEKSIWQNT